ncbi:hypothetical protein D3C75_1319240 [compost metagenome]
MLLQMTQRTGECAGADPGNAALQLTKPFGAVEQLAQNEEGPLAAQHLQCFFYITFDKVGNFGDIIAGRFN